MPSNRADIGEAVREGESCPDEHAALVDRVPWDRVHAIRQASPAKHGKGACPVGRAPAPETRQPSSTSAAPGCASPGSGEAPAGVRPDPRLTFRPEDSGRGSSESPRPNPWRAGQAGRQRPGTGAALAGERQRPGGCAAQPKRSLRACGALIYLDANATTRPLQSVIEAIAEAMRAGPANPSSPHEAGARARRLLEAARDDVCELLPGAEPEGVVFTSGGTEGNNAVVQGYCQKHPDAIVVTSNAEHPSVTRPVCAMPRHAQVPVSANGTLDPDALARALPRSGAPPLVALSWVNGETGVVQPIRDIAAAVRRARPDAAILLDGAQAVGRLPADEPPCDFLTFSGHKLHGPSGTGVLVAYDPDDDRLSPFILGGGQERDRRSGTQNVAGAVGLGMAAAERARDLPEAVEAMRRMRDAFEERVLGGCDGAVVNGADAPRVCNTSNVRFAGIEGMALLARLDQRDVACSVGSACSSARPEPSPTLLAMGLSEADAYASVRFSFSVLNTMEEALEAAERVVRTVGEMR